MKHPRKTAYALCAGGIASATWLAPGTAHAATVSHLKEAEQNKCLDIRTQDGDLNSGARLQRFTCHGVPEQSWEPIEVGSDTFVLRNPQSQMCVTTDTADFGAQVVQRPCDTANRGELWVADGPFVRGSGFVTLRSGLAPNSCLDTLDTFVKIFPCTAQNRAQLWELV
jgi:hypothetical protein